MLAAVVLLAGCSTDPIVTAGGSSSASAAAHNPLTLDGPATVTLPEVDPVPVAANPTPALPATIGNADGTETTVTSTDRIVAVDRYGTIGTTVFALGLGDHLVGRDIATKFPAAQDIPNLTVGGTGLSLEAVFALAPTVVLVDEGLPSLQVTREALTNAGVAVVVLTAERSVQTATSMITDIGAALGVPDAAAALSAKVTGEIDAAKETANAALGGAGGPTIGFIYARGPGLVLLGGKGSGADSLFDALGAVDVGVATGLTEPFTPVNTDALVTAAPSVLLLMSGGLTSLGGVDGLKGVAGLGQTPAVLDRRIIDCDDGLVLTFGPRTGEVLGALADALYG